MQATALRMARVQTRQVLRATGARRSLATAAATQAEGQAAAATAASSRKVAPIPLSNVEAQWTKLSEGEQAAVHEQLETIQQKDWKELSIDEKKAAYYVAFGPHGPRTPITKPGDITKILVAVAALVGVAVTLNVSLAAMAPPPPKTLTKEWQEASNERAREMKLNPLSGIASEGYSGKGFVQADK